jgi:hypothetical protein
VDLGLREDSGGGSLSSVILFIATATGSCGCFIRRQKSVLPVGRSLPSTYLPTPVGVHLLALRNSNICFSL